jgi:hypothetical protein
LTLTELAWVTDASAPLPVGRSPVLNEAVSAIAIRHACGIAEEFSLRTELCRRAIDIDRAGTEFECRASSPDEIDA